MLARRLEAAEYAPYATAATMRIATDWNMVAGRRCRRVGYGCCSSRHEANMTWSGWIDERRSLGGVAQQKTIYGRPALRKIQYLQYRMGKKQTLKREEVEKIDNSRQKGGEPKLRLARDV